MKINFNKDISDIARFRKMLIEFDSIVTDVSYDSSNNDGYCIVGEGTSTAEQTSISNYIADYSNILSAEETLINLVDASLKSARGFAFQIVNDFTNENVRMGITQLGKTKYVRTNLRELNECISTSSFYDAIVECDAIIGYINDPANTVFVDTDLFINVARITKFKNLLELFLGVPTT